MYKWDSWNVQHSLPIFVYLGTSRYNNVNVTLANGSYLSILFQVSSFILGLIGAEAVHFSGTQKASNSEHRKFGLGDDKKARFSR